MEKKRAHRAGDAGDDARARKGWEARENEKARGLALGGEDGEDAGARGARARDARGIWSTDDVLMFYRAYVEAEKKEAVCYLRGVRMSASKIRRV